MNFPILSLQILLPLCVGTLLMFWPKAQARCAQRLVVLTSTLSLGLSLWMAWGFSHVQAGMQFQELYPWFGNVQLHLGVDGLSMPMIVLTALTHWVIALSIPALVKERGVTLQALFLWMQGLIVGLFAALDAVLFYVCWEAMLVPMFLCIGMWGSANRGYASVKFFIYTFVSSTMMLLAILYCATHSQSFDWQTWWHMPLNHTEQLLLFMAFTLAFAVKIPMWPVHTWLPDAHTEAPTAGSVLLAAMMLKVGAYGLFRFSLPVTPWAAKVAAPWMVGFSLIAVVLIGLIALAQRDMKRLIAYSSVAHMGFVTLGAFLVVPLVVGHHTQAAEMALTGAWVQMIAHAFSSGGLFLAFGYLYARCHTRAIEKLSGVATVMPVFGALFVGFAMSNVGLPGTGGFVGEWLVLLATYQAQPGLALAAALTLILAAGYTLWMVKRVFFGAVSESVKSLTDLPCRDLAILSILSVAVVVLGIFPGWVLAPMQGSAQALVAHVAAAMV